ncbi:MAG TPA: hypothetical protein VMS86_13790 [Thermoanaerobaculia bacterium]|nr:hypothetical protein [Thermoanaerobaculia bacterium]
MCRLYFRCALSILVGALAGGTAASAYLTDTAPHAAPDYDTFNPPAKGQSWADPVYGTQIKRLSDATHTGDDASGGSLTWILNEYATMTAFNHDNSRLILLHNSYFGLYDGAGTFLRNLPFEIHAGSEPRWSRTNRNVIYYINSNRLKQYDVSNGAMSVVHTFSEYGSISGRGESDICFDGNHFVLVGDGRYIFVYTISTDSKGPVLDTSGRSFDSVYMTPDDNVTVTWNQAGSSRYNGVELFDRNLVFRRQVMLSGGHMDVTRDATGAEVMVWTNSNDPSPIPCSNGIVKVRLSDGQQTCLRTLDWSLAPHISCPDAAGWCIVGTYAPSEPSPTSWPAYTNEILQVMLDGSEVRRLAHHRSRRHNDYNYQPKATVSRDGSRFVFASNHNLQNILGYPSNYSDAFLISVDGSTGGTGDSGGTGDTTTGATTRVEENGAGVTRSAGHWYANTHTSHSGGSAILAMDAGAWVQFAFNGVGAKWIGYKDQWAGIARVYVDGVLKGTLDTYGTGEAQQVMYTVDNLADGSHTLMVEVAGSIGPQSSGAWVWVDAFESVAAATGTNGTGDSGDTGGTDDTADTTPVPSGWTRFQQDAAGSTYKGTWYDNVHAAHSDGSAVLAMLAGDSAVYKFTGTGVRWIGYRDQWAGIAQVYIDGKLVKKVDTYLSSGKAQQVLYSVEGLANEAHTLRIYVTGKKNRRSSGSWIWVDAFEVKN